MPAAPLLPGPDGRPRCWWSVSTPEYVDYHDTEWGQPLYDDDAMFERLALEGFQSGLSWLVILRKREAFRRAFDGFSIGKVAAYGESDRQRLLADTGIVRNRAKIDAAITNAQVARDVSGGLASYLWGFAPTGRRRAPRSRGDIPTESPNSVAMAKDLRKRGFRFVGPTTCYALMQASGMVDDHIRGCVARG